MKRALICNGDLELLQIQRRVLVEINIEVILITSTRWLLETLGEFGPDLLLLDPWTSERPGEEILYEIRNHPSFAKLPVIVCSNSMHHARTAWRHKCEYFLCDPFDREELIHLVTNGKRFLPAA